MEKRIRNTLIKVSGDLIGNERVLEFIKNKGEQSYVVVVLGAGTKITQRLEAEGIKFEFGPSGRITDFHGRQIARNILEEQQAGMQDLFIQEGVHAVVEIPVIPVGGVLCHINGDDYLKSIGYNTFGELYCLTTQERIEKKREVFREYPKIKVIGF